MTFLYPGGQGGPRCVARTSARAPARWSKTFQHARNDDSPLLRAASAPIEDLSGRGRPRPMGLAQHHFHGHEFAP